MLKVLTFLALLATPILADTRTDMIDRLCRGMSDMAANMVNLRDKGLMRGDFQVLVIDSNPARDPRLTTALTDIADQVWGHPDNGIAIFMPYAYGRCQDMTK